MPDHIQCPKCSSILRKGSTFCMKCGNKIPNDILSEHTLKENQSLGGEEVMLPAVEESGLDEIPEPEVKREIRPLEVEKAEAIEELSWDDELPSSSSGKPAQELEKTADSETYAEADSEALANRATSGLSWEEGVEEIKEGMPFKEIEPPLVYAEAQDLAVTADEALVHLFPEMRDDATRDAVAHLFPEGRGSTSPSFIDVVVGKPERISIKKPLRELETPACTSCGNVPTSDGFEYPPYVYDALGKARVENGDRLLEENEHEVGIENFEMAKLLFQKSGNEKNLAEVIKRIDFGYDSMAKFHYDQAENHLKQNEFEWAVVQFKKARELYMFSTDTKKRVRCAERARDAFITWGKALEDEGDHLAKTGQTRDALAKYQEAASKYREGEDTKRLKILNKKIRKA